MAETDRRQLTPEHRFKTRAEMAALFADLPEAIASTVEIAQRCAFRPRMQAPILPRFSVGSEGAAVDEAAELRKRAEAGLEHRIATHGLAPGRTVEDYRERLAFELSVIDGMKYPGYFLIVADFIQWAKGQGIPVGPGRGSGAGSLVAYALTITDLDPIRFGLLFERFLNPERVSMPDFDIDFCQDRRDEVIRYVQERYGRDRVAQIITFGTLQARGVLRDVGRVLQMPYGQVDKLCKLVPQNPANPVTLKRAIDDEPRLQAERDSDPVVARAFDIAQKLEGLHRHASTHAAGIVIGERPLTELVPLYRDPKSNMPVTQFNMKWVEPAGLVKFDFLGLKTLTVLQTAVALLRKRGIDIDLAAIPLDDEKTYAMLARAEAVGIFQLESQGMRRALLDMRPDRFEDIIALVALYRPGPMANIPTYCARKHGMEEPDYIHPKLEPILRETFGVIVYQEQVMQAAQILAGYSLGEADLLRRAMGKKIRSEMQKQRTRFVVGLRRARHRSRPGRSDLRIARAFRRLRLQQEPRRRLCAGRLPDRLHEGELSGRIPCGVDDARHGQYRQALGIPRRGRAPRHQGRAAVDQPLGRGVSRSRATPSTTRSPRSKASAARRSRRSSRRAASARSPILPILPAASIRAPSTSACWKAWLPPARSMRSKANRARVFAAVDTMLGGGAARPRGRGRRASRNCSAADRAAHAAGAADSRAVAAGRTAAEGVRRHRLLPLRAIRSTTTRPRSSACGCSRGPNSRAREGRRERRPRRRHGGRAHERRTRTGSKMGIIGLSDPSGHYEAVLFSEGLAQFRDLLEPGTAVLLTLSAELQGDDVRARIQMVGAARPGGGQAAEGPARVPARGGAARKRRQAARGSATRAASAQDQGEVSMVLMLGEGTEVEVKLPGRFKVSPQIAGAIKAIPGVVAVEAV